MQIKIIERKQEPLLSREMVRADIDFDKATPNYGEITSLVATSLKADEKLVAIRHVYTAFGNRKAEVTAYVYKDAEKKQSIEPKLKEKKVKKEQA